ncbi:MAG: 4-hydroxy-3-methylbut-2-enyl diphosphate reductase [Acidobacteria bacterium]|nr:4-hydroxy-3-methylbut-2-enyl diphosphate reductase [Acidobacteriota bacterium]
MSREVVRKGFGLKKEVEGDLSRDYGSELVRYARERGYELQVGDVTLRIAKEFGFCYGVERAVDYAYETRVKFPDRRLFITGEIIHNPRVNNRLRELEFQFLDGTYDSQVGIDALVPEDIVLLPAFGVPTDVMERLRATGCLLVDTTCGSVLAVWKNVERYARDGFTCLIHGKWKHEETRATASRAMLYPEGRYLVVLDLDEAEAVADYIEHGGDRGAFLDRFRHACSPDFDPDQHLGRIGMANQTTMLSSESLRIAGLIGRAMIARHGIDDARQRFRSFDTICSATQDRQDAVHALIETPPDVAIVIGGFNSSNTGHLAEICAERCPTYHVEGPDDLLDLTRIRHQPVGSKVPAIDENWLPQGAVDIGLTAGASTPDREIGRVMARLLELRGLSLPA